MFSDEKGFNFNIVTRFPKSLYLIILSLDVIIAFILYLGITNKNFPIISFRFTSDCISSNPSNIHILFVKSFSVHSKNFTIAAKRDLS